VNSAKRGKQGRQGKERVRRERRFEPRANASPLVVYLLGGIGALAMGAGSWGEFGSMVRQGGPEPFKYAPYILGFGAVLLGIAIWIGTSGEPPLRVGDGGLAIDRGGVRRMPWYAVDRVALDEAAVRVTGKDETGADMTIIVKLASHPQAAAWIVKEARDRVPKVVQLSPDVTLPEVRASAGEILALDPPQVVGKHCAASGKVIAYEPDAWLCPRCERCFHKAHVPDTCECGATLSGFKTQTKTA
jgi:hypothetical protein